MSRVDWQAYLDGSLAPEERALADRQLETDPQARRDLEGLRTFIARVKDASLAEEIPLRRLEAMIPTPTVRRSLWRRPAFAGALAVAATLLLLLFLRPWAEADPSNDITTTSDPVVAAAWAQERMPFKVPVIDLGKDRPLVRTHHHDGRCCFDYQVQGGIYHVNVLADPKVEEAGQPIKLATGVTAFLSNGIRWRQGNLTFYVVGPDRQVAVEVASATSSLLTKA